MAVSFSLAFLIKFRPGQIPQPTSLLRSYYLWGSGTFNAIKSILKNVKKKIAEAWTFIKINTSLWVLFTSFKCYKWYQIAQSITFDELEVYPVSSGHPFFKTSSKFSSVCH